MILHISTSSMTPIYEQIADQIRSLIVSGELKPGQSLPSVRACAKDYRISALTVKKAYDLLEKENLVQTVQGKGTYISEVSGNLVQEEMQKQIECEFEKAIGKARTMHLSNADILELVNLLLEEKVNDQDE